MRFSSLLVCCAAVMFAACHAGPVINAGAKQPSVGGTIAGLVTTVDRSVPVTGRVVAAVETKTGARFEAKTGENGGYTIKVPEGTYRIDVELHAGEMLVKRPEDTRVRNSDLDAQRDFVISAGTASMKR